MQMHMHDDSNSSLTVSQLAHRWGTSSQRIRTLVDQGRIPGAFRIPSAGRYGSAVRIPLSHILSLEESWQVLPKSQTTAKIFRRQRISPSISHFPELYDSLESDAECPSGDRRSDEHTA